MGLSAVLKHGAQPRALQQVSLSVVLQPVEVVWGALSTVLKVRTQLSAGLHQGGPLSMVLKAGPTLSGPLLGLCPFH